MTSMLVFPTAHDFSTYEFQIVYDFIDFCMWITVKAAHVGNTRLKACPPFVNIKLSTISVLF